jgi:hypothetical protein
MNYREAIQIQIKALQDIYDNAGGLRDVSFSSSETEAWNNVRRLLPSVWGPLQNVDDSLADQKANHQLKGDYSINVSS